MYCYTIPRLFDMIFCFCYFPLFPRLPIFCSLSYIHTYSVYHHHPNNKLFNFLSSLLQVYFVAYLPLGGLIFVGEAKVPRV